MSVYRPNPQGFEDCANGPEIAESLAKIGVKAKAIAEGLSEDFRITGEYAEGFELEYPIEPVKKGRPRRTMHLVNTSDHSVPVEWGREGTSEEPGQAAHHVLKRTLDVLGD